MQILRAASHRRMPWKNGAGVTTEIAVFPQGAGLADFEWRLSMATVASDGPFSSFAGIDRTLAVLEGEGIVLWVEGRPEARLTTTSAPLAFAADRPTSARLIDGPIVDLNVMTRRGLWTHRMERLVVSGSATITGGGLTIVFCASGAPTIVDGRETLLLSQQDAAIIDTVEVDAGSEPAELYIVRLKPIV
jgi:environmental stress-induced protein Ves